MNKKLYFVIGVLGMLIIAIILFAVTYSQREIQIREQAWNDTVTFYHVKDKKLNTELFELKLKAYIDSIDFVNKLKDAKKVSIKYVWIKASIASMSTDESTKFFFNHVTDDYNPDSVKTYQGGVLIPDTLIQNANLIFVDRDYYKEYSDSLDVAILSAKTALGSEYDVTKKQNEIINNLRNNIVPLNVKIKELEGEVTEEHKKVVRNRKIAWAGVGITTVSVGLLVLLLK